MHEKENSSPLSSRLQSSFEFAVLVKESQNSLVSSTRINIPERAEISVFSKVQQDYKFTIDVAWYHIELCKTETFANVNLINSRNKELG